MFTKICTKCGKHYATDTKDEMRTYFYRSKATKDGYVSACKICEKKIDKEKYQNRKYDLKVYYEENKEDFNVKRKEKNQVGKYLTKTIDRLSDSELEDGIEILQKRLDELKIEKYKRNL